MLVNAYGNAREDEINELITNGNYKYLNLSPINEYKFVRLQDNDYNTIQKVSLNDDGCVLAYFEANVDFPQNKIVSTCFVKFRYHYNEYRLHKNSEDIANKDFTQFVDEIMNHPIHNRIEVRAIVDNPANSTYEKWLEKYNGERFLLKDYTKLADGKLYDTYIYWFMRGER